MKRFLILSAILLAGCSTLTAPTKAALLTSAENLAATSVKAVAQHYGGAVAGDLASAGLSALGSVLQGYVGAPVPPEIVKASPGVAGLGQKLVALVSSKWPVTQKVVDDVHRAAAIAAGLTSPQPTLSNDVIAHEVPPKT
jgi:hypothetical protein